MTGRLAGKVAFITGAGMGMGREAAILFVDLSGFTGLTNRESYVKCIEAMLDDPGIDLVKHQGALHAIRPVGMPGSGLQRQGDP